MQKSLWTNFGILVSSLLLPLTMNAQHATSSQNEQQTVFQELNYLNQNFKNPVKKRNGFSLVASTSEQYDGAQFVKSFDSLRYNWVGNRGETFDILSSIRLLNAVTYGGVVFAPLTDASAIRNDFYQYDTIEFYRLLLNTNTYGDLYQKRIAELDANARISAHSEVRLLNNNNWQENVATSYLFDNQNRLIEVLEKRNQNGTLTNNSKTTYTYNAADKVEVAISSSWIAGTWADNYKYSHVYDNNNNLIDYTVEIWQNGDWNKITRVLLEYNSNNKVITRTSQMGATGTWENSRIWHYNYVNDNIATIETRGWSAGTWTSISGLFQFSYNNLDQCISKTEYLIDTHDTLIYRTLYSYNSVNEIEGITWQNGGETREDFNDFERWVFEYGNAGLTRQYNQKKINNVWDYFYEGPGAGAQSFMNHYYYNDSNTNISNLKNVALAFSVYPNPGSGNLSVDIATDEIKYVVITDLSGKEILRVNYSQKVKKAEIDISGIAAGNYMLTAGNESGYGVKKVSIIK